MIEKLLFEIFNKQPTLVKPLNKGITNDNYYIEVDNQAYIMRVPSKANQAIFNRHHEKVAMDLVEVLDINLEPTYFDLKSGIKITPYYPNLLELDEYQQADKISKVASLMKTLHRSELKSGFPFDPVKRFYTFYNRLEKHLCDYQPYLKVIEQVKNKDAPLILCHNDWVNGNICFLDNEPYLIDYEYAGDNDPLFDVMSFLTENNLTELEKQEFLNHYFDNQLSPELKKKLTMWENFHNLLWAVWANMMYEQSSKEIFLEIMNDKYQALLTGTTNQ
jgi:thiamine kinase-like enzyme